MNKSYVKAALYAVAFLTPLASQASNSEHERKHSHPQENYHSQQSYRDTGDTLPAVSVPEPGALALVSAGVFGLILARRKKV